MALGARNGNSKPIKAGMAWGPMRYPPRSKGLRRKGGIKLEKMGDYSLLFAIEVNPISGLDCRIERPVGCKQIGRHLIGIIEIGQSRVGIAGSGIHHTLGARLDAMACLRRNKLLNGQREVFGLCPRPGESVVDDSIRIPIIAFQASANHTHPRVVGLGHEHAEVIQTAIRHKIELVAGNHAVVHEAHWHILASLRGNRWNSDIIPILKLAARTEKPGRIFELVGIARLRLVLPPGTACLDPSSNHRIRA